MQYLIQLLWTTCLIVRRRAPFHDIFFKRGGDVPKVKNRFPIAKVSLHHIVWVECLCWRNSYLRGRSSTNPHFCSFLVAQFPAFDSPLRVYLCLYITYLSRFGASQFYFNLKYFQVAFKSTTSSCTWVEFFIATWLAFLTTLTIAGNLPYPVITSSAKSID